MSDLDTAEAQLQAAIAAASVGATWADLRAAAASLGQDVASYDQAGDLVAAQAALNIQATVQNIVNQSPNPCGTLANLQQGTLTSLAQQITTLPPQPSQGLGLGGHGGWLVAALLVCGAAAAVVVLQRKGD